jgi:hypothetical protein
MEKLDRILINGAWEIMFLLTNARKIPRVMSDHNPVIVDIDEKPKLKSREKHWTHHPDFQERVKKLGILL